MKVINWEIDWLTPEIIIGIVGIGIALLALLFGQGWVRDWLKKRKEERYKTEIQIFDPTKDKICYKILEYIDKNRTVMEEEIFFPSGFFDELKARGYTIDKDGIIEHLKNLWAYDYIKNVSEHDKPYYRITKKGKRFLIEVKEGYGGGG